MPNMNNIVKAHNMKILRKEEETNKKEEKTAKNFWRETTSLVNRWHHLHVLDTWHQQTHVCLRICVCVYI